MEETNDKNDPDHDHDHDHDPDSFALVKLNIKVNIMRIEQIIELFDFIIDELKKINADPVKIKELKELVKKYRESLESIKTDGRDIEYKIDELLKEINKEEKLDICNLGYYSDIGCDY